VAIEKVAEALRLTVRAGRFQCPAGCDEDKRQAADWGARLWPGKGWKCWRCDASGDALRLVAFVLTGDAKPADAEAWAPVREWYAAHGWCEGEEDEQARRKGEDSSGSSTSRTTTSPTTARRPRTPEPPPPRPEGAADVWAACRPVLDDLEVAAWLRTRGLDPARVEDRDLARALPEDLDVPRWMFLRPEGDDGPLMRWTDGWRCVLPAYDAEGRLVSMRARWCRPAAAPGKRKEAAAAAGAGSATGLVLADALGRELLRTGALPEWWEDSEDLAVVVAEGCPDFLTWAVRWSEAALYAPAVLGLWGGSWTWPVGRRVPDGARVALRPHRDKAGDGYAWRDAWPTLTGRCDVVRPDLAPVPPGATKAPDDNDLLRAGLLGFDPFEDWHGTEKAAVGAGG